MKRILLGIALVVLGGTFFASFRTVPGFALGGTLIAAGAVMLLTALSGEKTASLLRLDHFFSFLRKKLSKETLGPQPWYLRFARRILPAALFSDRITGKPGLVRRVLKWLGPSVHSAPLRRIVQAACFLLFLYLFFYVCWPYSAVPVGEGPISPGWRLAEVEAESGNLKLTGGRMDAFAPPAGSKVAVVDDRAPDAIRGEFGSFEVVSTGDPVVLRPTEPPADRQLDALLTSAGTWSIHAHAPWPAHYTEELAGKEFVPADFFLVIDPLVSLSTAIASRSWVWSLASAAAILIVCLLIPRGFCGYICPLGSLIDLFDWAIAGRTKRFRVPEEGGWWVHIKYYLLLGTLVCAAGGVLVSGYVAAIPVITRGMLFLGEPLQSGMLRGWGQVPPLHAGHFVSIALLGVVLGLGFLRPRFWCKYVCPSGAVFSLGNLFRLTDRKVETTCINCNRCVEICPFDAIKPDFTTRGTDCTQCQTCAGVCPTQAIKFVERWNLVELKVENDPPTGDTKLGRRGFVSLAAGLAAALFGGGAMTFVTRTFGARLETSEPVLPVRPPGSVPEPEFLQMCIRCGECFKACPYNVLQPLGFEQGLEGLWTPAVFADHAGCAPSCNACGQVCPTGAIRALGLEEKRVARMGLAVLNLETCLPHAGREACQLCVDDCIAAGYHAMEFIQVHTEVDADGLPVEGSGYLAPVVLAEKCVGCGMCQMACYQFNVHQKDLLEASAIVVEAGEGKEDRMMTGSYRALRREEARQRAAERRAAEPPGGGYFTPVPREPAGEAPFGLGEPPADNSDHPFGLGL